MSFFLTCVPTEDLCITDFQDKWLETVITLELTTGLFDVL